MSAPFVCSRCFKVCGPYDRIERRIEMRDARSQARYRVYLESKLCKTCADAELESVRPTVQQGRFL